MSSFAPRRAAIDAEAPQVPGVAATSRRDLAARWAWPAVSCCYLLAALFLTWRLWADPGSRMVAGNTSDNDLFAWYLRYAAAAVAHGRLPALVTTAMNAPQGINMMWNTSLLLPAVLLAPVTMLLGPQVSLTILTTAGFAGSAMAMFWVLRRWRVSAGAAALAGAVYGFSPALLQSAIGHFNLQLAILPPLIIDAGLRLAAGRLAAPTADRTGQEWLSRLPAPVRDGAWLGWLITAQLFISEEIALTTALAGLLLAAGLAIARPRAALRRIGPAAAGLAVAGAVTLAVAGRALLVQFAGPLRQHGPLFPPDFYVNDLSGFVTPSSYLVFRTSGSVAAAAGYQGGATEYLAYLGWPLIIVVAVAAVACWRRPAARALALAAVLLAVFSLGGHPWLGGRMAATVSLPWHWIEARPLVASVLPDRLSILIDAAAAALLAIGIDAVRARLAARPQAGVISAEDQATGRPGGLLRPAAGRVTWLVMAAAIVACLPLLPRPLPAASAEPVPSGWSGAFAALRLPPGAQVLFVPVPANFLTAAMRWQADTGQPVSLIGGYFIGPGAPWTRGQEYIDGSGTTATAGYLDRLWAAGLPPGDPYLGIAHADDLATAGQAGPASAGQAPALAQVRADFAAWRPAAVVAVTSAGSPLDRYLVHLLGRPAARYGSVIAWRGP